MCKGSNKEAIAIISRHHPFLEKLKEKHIAPERQYCITYVLSSTQCPVFR